MGMVESKQDNTRSVHLQPIQAQDVGVGRANNGSVQCF